MTSSLRATLEKYPLVIFGTLSVLLTFAAGYTHFHALSLSNNAPSELVVTLLKKFPLVHRCLPEGRRQSHHSQCYGEIAVEGMFQMLRALPKASACALTPDSTFYDVGSGLGRFSLFMRMKTNISKVVGVELNGCRAKAAMTMHAALRNASVIPRERLDALRFLHADINEQGFHDATHLFLSSQCWPDETLAKLFETARAHRPNLRCVVKFGHDARPDGVGGAIDRWGHIERVGRADATFGPGMSAIMLGAGPCTGERHAAGQCRNWEDARRAVCTFDKLYCGKGLQHLYNHSEQERRSDKVGSTKYKRAVYGRRDANFDFPVYL